MAATELLDYNQVQEQSPSTGDNVPRTGGPIIWQFRADPNLAWDPSQSFFAMDVQVSGRNGIDGSGIGYNPGSTDLRPFFPLRCFDSCSHVIDGVTVASSTHPYLDKVIQEKFLHETTQSNYSNFESAQLARAIDDGIKEHNIFRSVADNAFDLFEQGWRFAIQRYNGGRQGYTDINESSTYATHTVIFQPPFDFWTKHQRVSGGNHQILLNLRPADTTGTAGGSTGGSANPSLWGTYVRTSCVGLDGALAAQQSRGFLQGTAAAEGGQTRVLSGSLGGGVFAIAEGSVRANVNQDNIKMDILRIRLMRRMVRFTVERPIATQEYNLTEMQLYVGQPSSDQMTQNFLLPSSTFGLVFFWRKSSNSFYDVYNDYPVTRHTISPADGTVDDYTGVTITNETKHFLLDEFYFTYGGETYPAQRINDISGNTGGTVPLGYEKMQLLSNQLMGVYNMPMEYLNTTYGGQGLMNRLDSQMFFFPVAKHSNSDNSDLQVFWRGSIRNATGPGAAMGGTPLTTDPATLCVVALYDARIELSYNSANQLEKVTKTEWK